MWPAKGLLIAASRRDQEQSPHSNWKERPRVMVVWHTDTGTPEPVVMSMWPVGRNRSFTRAGTPGQPERNRNTPKKRSFPSGLAVIAIGYGVGIAILVTAKTGGAVVAPERPPGVGGIGWRHEVMAPLQAATNARLD